MALDALVDLLKLVVHLVIYLIVAGLSITHETTIRMHNIIILSYLIIRPRSVCTPTFGMTLCKETMNIFHLPFLYGNFYKSLRWVLKKKKCILNSPDNSQSFRINYDSSTLPFCLMYCLHCILQAFNCPVIVYRFNEIYNPQIFCNTFRWDLAIYAFRHGLVGKQRYVRKFIRVLSSHLR